LNLENGQPSMIDESAIGNPESLDYAENSSCTPPFAMFC
jgi:hypothetical protein